MALEIKKRITLDISRIGYQVTVPFMKSDRVAHELIITVINGFERVKLPPGVMASIAVFNGLEGGTVDTLVVDHANDLLIYTPSQNALAVEGNIKASITLYDEYGAIIGVPSLIFAVAGSDTDMTAEAIEEALQANESWGLIVDTANNAKDAAASALKAEGYAMGTQDGAPVGYGSPYYFDNAYYQAYLAKSRATEAKESEEAAAESAANAAKSENNAAASSASASESEKSAKNDALAAKEAAEMAEDSKDIAVESAEAVANAREEIDTQINNTLIVANDALTVAKGATQALVFNTLRDAWSALRNAEAEKFNPGQNLLIKAKDVPDLWVNGRAASYTEYVYVSDEKFIRDIVETNGLSVGYYTVGILETQKVDLSEYFKRTEVPTVVREALQQANQTGDFDGRNAQIAYSFNPDGTGFTTEWQEGQKYIGFAVDYIQPADKTAYEWVYIGSVALSASIKDDKLVIKQQGQAYKATVTNGVLIFE